MTHCASCGRQLKRDPIINAAASYALAHIKHDFAQARERLGL
jgi:hypothetical protein